MQQSLLSGLREFVANQISRHRERAQALGDLSYLAPDDVEALSADCGLNPSQFRQIVGRGSHAADELLELSRALGVDIEKLPRRAANDMKLICAECHRKALCRKSFKSGTAARDHMVFCDNAELLAEAKRELQSES
jgi:hypothetical protein